MDKYNFGQDHTKIKFTLASTNLLCDVDSNL